MATMEFPILPGCLVFHKAARYKFECHGIPHKDSTMLDYGEGQVMSTYLAVSLKTMKCDSRFTPMKIPNASYKVHRDIVLIARMSNSNSAFAMA